MRVAVVKCVDYLWSRITPAHLLLIPLSWIFFFICKIRRAILTTRQVKLPIPVIVVGNISVGGNGKTTLVIALAKILTQRGYKVGIITRGYKRRYPKTTILVNHQMDPAIIGDEACMMWNQCKCLIGVSSDRNRAAKLLCEADCQLILSDDGLQRYDFYRDIEIAVSSEQALGNKCLLPAGPLRERESRVDQCTHTINLIGNDNPSQVHDRESTMHYEVCSIDRLDGQQTFSMNDFPKDKPYRAICALGNAQGFFNLLRAHALMIETTNLPDHDVISEKVLEDNGKDIMISEKDAVKLSQHKHMKHIWVVKVKPVICTKSLRQIIDSIESKLTDHKQANEKNTHKAIESL